MTRSIFEPSTSRTEAKLGFGSNQLFRRPAPPSTSDFAWARISKGFDASNQTINNNTNTDLTFNHDYNMGAGESGENVFQTTGTTGLTILEHGIYLMTAEVYWNTNPTAPWMFTISDTDAWLHGNYFESQNSQDQFGLVSLPMRIDPNATYFATVWHFSGSSRLVDAFYLEAIKIGDYTGTERAAMDPNQ